MAPAKTLLPGSRSHLQEKRAPLNIVMTWHNQEPVPAGQLADTFWYVGYAPFDDPNHWWLDLFITAAKAQAVTQDKS